jgi:hypothetical protein
VRKAASEGAAFKLKNYSEKGADKMRIDLKRGTNPPDGKTGRW